MACNFHAAMRHTLVPACLLLLVAAATAPASAQTARASERQLPMTIEAERQGTADLARRIVTFSGNVVITQGTLRITADRVEVREGAQGVRHAMATGVAGQPATFRRQRDGVDETIEGRAERIDYDGGADTLRLSGQAVLRLLRGATLSDEVSGQVITYDNLRETFQVTGGDGGRVRAVLTPREALRPAAPPTPPAATPRP
jgi:lipopolysaccharide export system protein LptA